MMYMKKLEYSAPLKKFSLIASFMLVAAIFVACGDDESFAVRPGEDEKSCSSTEESSSSSVSSSSLAKSNSSSAVSSSSNVTPRSSSSETSVSSSGVTPQSSFSETSVSSSSSARSSSSSQIVPCKTETEDNCVYGTLVDDRDGQTYKTVTIGSQTWMAENLNYAARYSTCYKNDAANCSKYGRYYTWDIAIDSASLRNAIDRICGNGYICEFKNPIRGVCPRASTALPMSLSASVFPELVGPSASA